MVRLNRRRGRGWPLNEVWADTAPGIHELGIRQANRSEDPDLIGAGAGRPLIRAAGTALVWAARTWRLISEGNAPGGQSDRAERAEPAQPAVPGDVFD